LRRLAERKKASRRLRRLVERARFPLILINKDKTAKTGGAFRLLRWKTESTIEKSKEYN